MLLTIILISIALIALSTLKSKNHFLKKVQNMNQREKARLLIHTTLLRLLQEKNPLTPIFAQVFMNPEAYPPDTCKNIYYGLLDQLVQFQKARKSTEKRLKQIGAERGLPELIYIEDGLCVWMQTVGTNCNMGKFTDVQLIWDALHESIPLIPDVLEEMEQEHKLSLRLGITSNFLQGFSPEELIIKAEDRPSL